MEDNLDIGAITGIYAGCMAAFILVVGLIVAGSMYAIIKVAIRQNKLTWENVTKELAKKEAENRNPQLPPTRGESNMNNGWNSN